MKKQKQKIETTNQLTCPECNSHDINKIERHVEIVYYVHETNYEGETLDLLDRNVERQGEGSLFYECANCSNFDYDIEVFSKN